MSPPDARRCPKRREFDARGLIAASGARLAFFASSVQAESYVVGTWNLEHFHEKATGGFPESHK